MFAETRLKSSDKLQSNLSKQLITSHEETFFKISFQDFLMNNVFFDGDLFLIVNPISKKDMLNNFYHTDGNNKQKYTPQFYTVLKKL